MNSLTNIRKLALLAALPAAVLVANNAMAAADVYGKINISLQQESEESGTPVVDTKDTWALETNASRLGFKTSTDLGDTGLKGVAKLEYEVDADDGATTFAQRNIYAGVQGGFGTVIAGKFDTPMKESQGKVDMFNDYIYGDIKNILTVGEDRQSNIIMYSTPKMESGLAINFAVVPGEESETAIGTDLNGDGDKEDDSFADSFSASVVFDSEMFYAALAVNDSLNNRDIIRLTGQGKFGAFTVGAIIQQAEVTDDDANEDGVQDIFFDQSGVILSTSFTMGNSVFKAQYGTSENEDDTDSDDVELESFSLGYDYKLSKDAMVYAYLTDWSSEEGAAEAGKDTFGVGYELKF